MQASLSGDENLPINKNILWSKEPPGKIKTGDADFIRVTKNEEGFFTWHLQTQPYCTF